MTGPERGKEPGVYCDMCHGILPMDICDRQDLARGQLIVAAFCVPVALLFLLLA